MELPPDVHSVPSGKDRTYYYHQKGRNTPKAGPRTSLGSDIGLIWSKYREIIGDATDGAGALPPPAIPRSFRAMVEAWRGVEGDPQRLPSMEWMGFAAATKKDYTFYTDKMIEFWSDIPARDISAAGALRFRDTFRGSPGSANHAISVGKGLFKFGVPLEFATINPFREIAMLPTDDDGHWPWPQWARDYVADNAPEDLARFVFLGAQTGQRESDIVRFGHGAREGAGLWVRPKKTKRRRKAVFVPLTSMTAITIDQWSRSPMVFSGGRWGKIITVAPGDFYVLSPTGKPYTEAGLRSRWNRWLAKDAGKAFLTRWTAHERALRERDGEDVPADATFKPTLHGLRSTAVVMRRMAGYTHQQVSNDIGMSIPMVTGYSRFMDQREAAENNIINLELAVDRRSKNAL
jgi:integrase